MAAKFFDSQEYERPSLLYVDEGMDFFGPSGNSRYGNAIQKCFRAGREKGLATCIGVQRPKAINVQTLTEANLLYLFKLDYSADVKRLVEMGLPEGITAPTELYKFRHMRDGELLPGVLHLPATLAK